jgi:hypothetical protein
VATCDDPDTAAYIAAVQPSVVQYLVMRERLKRGNLHAAFVLGAACAYLVTAAAVLVVRVVGAL